MQPSRPTTRGAGPCDKGRPAGHGSSRHRDRPPALGAQSTRDQDLRWTSPKLSWADPPRGEVPRCHRGPGYVNHPTGLWTQGGREAMMWLMVDERDGSQPAGDLDRSEGFGERLLGSLLD